MQEPTNPYGKKNREELRRLMGAHDVSADQTAALLDLKASTIHQYRSIGGLDISDAFLALLREKLTEAANPQ